MNSFIQNTWVKASESSYVGTPLQKLIGSLNESNTTSDIEAYKSVLTNIIQRVGITSVLPYITSVIPGKTTSGKVPVIYHEYVGAKETVKTGAVKIFTVADSSGFVVDGPVTSATASGTVLHVEDNKLLVDVTSGTFAVSDPIDNATPFVTGATTIDSITTPLVSVGNILKDYTGPYTTADGEALTTTTAREFKLRVENVEYVSKTRKSFTGMTVEFLQDMLMLHGIDGKNKAIEIISSAIEKEIEQEFFVFLKSIARQKPDLPLSLSYGTQSALGTGGVFEDIMASIMKSIAAIGTATGLSGPYFVIGSSNVVGALKHITKIYKKPEFEAVNSAYVGHILNHDIILIEDSYSYTDYITVGQVGPKDANNSGTIFIPCGIDFVEAVDPTSLESIIAVMNRYDMIRSPLDTNATGASDFYHTQVINFSNLTNYDKI